MFTGQDTRATTGNTARTGAIGQVRAEQGTTACRRYGVADTEIGNAAVRDISVTVERSTRAPVTGAVSSAEVRVVQDPANWRPV